MFGEPGRWLLLNPVAPVLEGLSSCIVFHRPPDAGWLLYSATVSVLLLLFAYAMFKNLEPRFAERI